ncbi:MAG: hypothetical protein IT329_10490 [Caldilineaceae bacterium]|nr:hypothetical protein [Caldilineaceae bacterium]
MDALLTLERQFVRWLAKDLRQRMVRRAALAAQHEFVRRCPDWHAALFDEHFVRTWALPLLAEAADNTCLPATLLAAAWAHQFGGTQADHRRRQAEAMPIAACYLQLVAEALQIEYDGAAWRGQPDLYPAG